MTWAYDEDVVLAKASHIRRTVETIRCLSGPENAGLKDWIRDDVTVLNLQRAVEALLDLASHLISANGWELPRDGRHAFAILRSHGLLTEPEQGLAGAMVGFRNVAVHDYAALDVEIVRGIARNRLGDLESLVSALLGRLRPAGSL
jgi:uncharacterized protein YutE (UPF0331/DUF86 family)